MHNECGAVCFSSQFAFCLSAPGLPFVLQRLLDKFLELLCSKYQIRAGHQHGEGGEEEGGVAGGKRALLEGGEVLHVIVDAEAGYALKPAGNGKDKGYDEGKGARLDDLVK